MAVVISADFTCAGVQFGWRSSSSAAAPATCGVAMLVPDCGPKPVNGLGIVADGVAARDDVDARRDDVGLERLVLRRPDELNAAMTSPMFGVTCGA